MPELFRSEALERLRSPEQLDSLLRLARPSAWAILLILAVIVALAVAWGFFGRIPIRVQGLGVILPAQAKIYSLQSQTAGIVQSVKVAPHDAVVTGQKIAVLSLPVNRAELESTQKQLRLLQRQYESQTKYFQEETERRRKITAELESTLKMQISDSNENLDFLRNLLAIQTAELEKGYYTRQQVESTRSSVFAATQAIANARDQMTQNKVKLIEFENQTKLELQELEREIAQMQGQLDTQLATIDAEKAIDSPVDGVVSEVDVKPGELVEAGQSVAVVEQHGSELYAEAYFRIGDGKQISEGMEAEVSPTSVQRDRYGSIRAKVLSVSPLPETENAIVSRLGNATLAAMMMGGGAPIRCMIALLTDSATVSGLRWTSSHGPDTTVTPGDTAAISVVTRKVRPIELVIPLFGDWTRDP